MALLLAAILPPIILVIVFVLIVRVTQARLQTARDRAYASWFGLALTILVAVLGIPAVDKFFNVGWDIFAIYIAFALPLVALAVLFSLGGICFSIAVLLKQRDWILFGIAAITVLLLLGVAIAQINRASGSFLDSVYFLPIGILYELLLLVSSGWWFLIGQKKD